MARPAGGGRLSPRLEHIATLWQRVHDSELVADLGVEWRPAEETLTDLYRWYLETGRLPASAVPAFQAEAFPSLDSRRLEA